MLTSSCPAGARVEIRDEEWLVRRSDPARSGLALTVVGVSELVRDVEAVFLTELDTVTVLRPEETSLVTDPSPGHAQSRLYLEALLRRSPPTDDALTMGHQGAVRPTPYQWVPAAKALAQPRPRLLIADGVGLGKTIEVGVLLTELIRRGRGKRILVVALKSLLSQLQAELWARFTIPLVRLDSVGIQRVQAKIPSNQNPFLHFDRCIVSVDTLKKDERYRQYLEDCRWDAVVIDECQNVAQRGNRRNQRARLARLLARRTDALILTSATPHDGRPESFASLVRLLEPTAITDDTKYDRDDVEHLFVRRFQKDVRSITAGAFHERDVDILRPGANAAEDDALRAIHAARFLTIGRSRNTDALFRTLIFKAWLSSPAAAIATLTERRKKLAKRELTDDVRHDLTLIDNLIATIQPVADDPAKQSKLQRLLRFLEEDLGWKRRKAGKRLVLFSERIDTLRMLSEAICAHFDLATAELDGDALTKGAIATFHGGLADREQYALVQDFSNRKGRIRLLLGSDAASEGLNLHHACHHLIHYDVPWSIMTLEQRNGRIDRYGQDQPPIIRYLQSSPGDLTLLGDQRVIDVLIAKEQQAHANLGDVAWLMNLHSPEAEERAVTQGVQEGIDLDALFAGPDDDGVDPFAALFDTPTEVAAYPEPQEPFSLYTDDLALAREGFGALRRDGHELHLEWPEGMEGFRLLMPEDLQLRYRYLPPELRPKDRSLQLTTNRDRVMGAYAKARDTQEGWPDWELFWQHHPVAEWLNDRVLSTFRRHEAPVITVTKGLQGRQIAYVFQGVLANARSQAVKVDWSGFVLDPTARSWSRVDFEALASQTGLDASVPNTGRTLDTQALTLHLRAAVPQMASHLRALKLAYETEAATLLRPRLRALRSWTSRSKDTLRNRGLPLRQLEQQLHEVDQIYAERKEWLAQSVKCSNDPYIRLAAVLVTPEVR